MRGFLLGSFGLIVLYGVISHAENAGKALSGTSAALARFLSPQVAGVPDFSGRKAAAAAKAAAQPQATPDATVNPTFGGYLAPPVASPSAPRTA